MYVWTVPVEHFITKLVSLLIMGAFLIVVVVIIIFYMALFSTFEQTHCAPVT